MPTAQILIVGAGPTGLVLAIGLARRGVAVRVIDKQPGPGLASRAMAVQARTLEFYQQFGFADEVVARGVSMEGIHLREGGREVAHLDVRGIGTGISPFPFVLSFPQDDHERFLVEKLAAAGVRVEWGVELKGFMQDSAGVRAILARGGTEEVCEAAYLCGCDGAHSRVRHVLGIDFPGGPYEQIFYVADARIAGPWQTHLIANIASYGFALMLPVRSSGMERLIGVVPAALAGRTDLTFDDIRPAVEPLLGVRVEQVNWFSRYHVHHRVAARFRVGRAFLSGDAGHIHSPAGGQGMNTGIGDAVNLAWKLAAVVRGRAAATILDSYEPERIAFARSLVATTDRAFRFLVNPGWRGRLARKWVIPFAARWLTRLPVVRRGIFNILSQVRVRYPNSLLSRGHAGRVRGGDRLPWVASAGNFAPLASLDWRLHVYGAVRRELSDSAVSLGLPVDTFAWGRAAALAGLKRDAAYLVRPDGYVALAWANQDPRALTEYVAKHGLRFG